MPRFPKGKFGRRITTIILHTLSCKFLASLLNIITNFLTRLSVDGELRKAMMELPSFFQPDQTTKVPPSNEPKALVRYYEKTILNLAIHSRMLRLHRPWLSRGYKDERFAYSKEQCIRAARASLRMMSDGTASYLEKWWLPLFYVSVSGLVVIIDLLVSLDSFRDFSSH